MTMLFVIGFPLEKHVSEDGRTLYLPDRPGNNRLDTIRNLLSGPGRIGLMFMIPGFDDVLRVNGRASASADPDLLAKFVEFGKTPRLVLMIAGNDNTVKLRGLCKAVRVPGNHNTIIAGGVAGISLDGNGNTFTIAGVDTISVNGNKNIVRWTKTLDGSAEPDVTIWGEDNTVTKK